MRGSCLMVKNTQIFSQLFVTATLSGQNCHQGSCTAIDGTIKLLERRSSNLDHFHIYELKNCNKVLTHRYFARVERRLPAWTACRRAPASYQKLCPDELLAARCFFVCSLSKTFSHILADVMHATMFCPYMMAPQDTTCSSSKLTECRG